jgi:hypothetical protein
MLFFVADLLTVKPHVLKKGKQGRGVVKNQHEGCRTVKTCVAADAHRAYMYR